MEMNEMPAPGTADALLLRFELMLAAEASGLRDTIRRRKAAGEDTAVLEWLADRIGEAARK
jgi:hypothetical protein